MTQSKTTLKIIPDTALRRLRVTPSYFFLIWRWSMWLYALVVIVGAPPVLRTTQAYHVSIYFLFITLAQSIIVTLYAPIFHVFLPRLLHSGRLHFLAGPILSDEEEITLVPPLGRAGNPYWNVLIYSLDLLVCGLATYLTGPFLNDPNFGVSSPFYRYGMSTALAAAFAFRYRGGLTVALCYDLFALLGAVFPPSGPPYTANILDLVGSIIDTPVAALTAAFLATYLDYYIQSKKREQENVRRQKALLQVGETIVREANDRQRLLQKSVEQIRKGGHFQRLVAALPVDPNEEAHNGAPLPGSHTCIETEIAEASLPARADRLIEQVIQTKEKLVAFEPASDARDARYGLALMYLPFFHDGQVRMILGAESKRQRPFDDKQESFLTIAGTQLMIALDNIRLAEQTIQLAAKAERSRIAREIHDGVAQLVYMLSLNAETCATQAHRIAEAYDEDTELLTPLAERLDKLVTISKQALWETRNYMFSLKPLMSGTATLTQMLTNQLREFEAISNITVSLEIEGHEPATGEDGNQARRRSQVGSAIFRIVQEALSNAYKHAQATKITVYLRFLPDGIEVEIDDNGRGLQAYDYSKEPSDGNTFQPIYFGHGLQGMHERVTEMGGTFAILQAPTGGVQVRARIPLF